MVGQTPPPFGGQAVMIEKMLEATYRGVELHHVRMAFSEEMDDVGRFQVSKIIHLMGLIARIARARYKHKASVLYYPPAGPDLVPMVRDVVILLCTRWLFKTSIFHFHAGGVGERLAALPRIVQPFFRLAYNRPDVGVKVAHRAPQDPEALRAKHVVVVHNGVDDLLPNARAIELDRSLLPLTILYVGVIKESKGVEVLVAAAHRLKEEERDFRIRLVGRCESAVYEARLHRLISDMGLEDRIQLDGVLVGEEKIRAFRTSDIFAFPTFFEAETSGVVLVEAMQFSIPIVATKWRGIPDLVDDGVNGYLVSPRDEIQLADRLGELLEDESLRSQMGAQGREQFEHRFTVRRYREGLQSMFDLAMSA